MSSRPRGRPRKYAPEQALKAVAERFRARGFAGASLDELAEAAGLSRPSLQAAFGDKRALFLHALAREGERLDARLAALAAMRAPLRETLARLFAEAIHGYLSGERGPSGCLATGVAPAEAAADPAIRQALAQRLVAEERGLAELLAACGSPAPEPHTRLVAATLHSLGIRARAGEGRDALERLARDCVAMMAG